MVPFSIHFNEKWRSFPHTDFSFEKPVSCIWINLYPMYKSYLCWFSELLWKESVCISARKFYDEYSTWGVCLQAQRTGVILERKDWGRRIAASESGGAYATLFEEYGSQIFLTAWLNVFQWCTWTPNGLCVHAWLFSASVPPSHPCSHTHPQTSLSVSGRTECACLQPFPSTFPDLWRPSRDLTQMLPSLYKVGFIGTGNIMVFLKA